MSNSLLDGDDKNNSNSVLWTISVLSLVMGEITVGAFADLILVNGNPLKDLNLVADPENNFDLIMKDGKIYKNTL